MASWAFILPLVIVTPPEGREAYKAGQGAERGWRGRQEAATKEGGGGTETLGGKPPQVLSQHPAVVGAASELPPCSSLWRGRGRGKRRRGDGPLPWSGKRGVEEPDCRLLLELSEGDHFVCEPNRLLHTECDQEWERPSVGAGA